MLRIEHNLDFRFPEIIIFEDKTFPYRKDDNPKGDFNIKLKNESFSYSQWQFSKQLVVSEC